MHAFLKRLVLASFINLAGNSVGTLVALQQDLAAKLGSVPNSQSVLEDFLGLKGTALSAPLSFMLFQLVVTLLAPRPGWLGRVGIAVLTFIGLFYTLAQAGEPIVLEQFRPGGFDPVQFIILAVNIATAVLMLVFGIKAWRTMRASQPVAGR
jgi:hypothetical protein